MSTSIGRFAHIRPTLLRTLSGKWLAVSEEGSQLHIGVEANSEQEVRDAFAKAIKAWERLWTDG